MATKTVKVTVEVSLPDIPEAVRLRVERRACEAAVLALWEAEGLTIREAAAELDLAYHEFLDLLTRRGIPIARGDLNLEAIEAAERKLAGLEEER